MERLRNWSRDELVLLVLFWICLSLSGLFYLLAGAERRLQTKLMQYQPSLNSPDSRLGPTTNFQAVRPTVFPGSRPL
jgi:hypothetical protein